MGDGPRGTTMMDLLSKENVMRSNYLRGVLLTLGLVLVGNVPGIAAAQEFGSSLLPIPAQSELYQTLSVAHQDENVLEAVPGDNSVAADMLPIPSASPTPSYRGYRAAMQRWGIDLRCTCGTGKGCDNGSGAWFGSVGALTLGSPTRNSTYLSYDGATFNPVMQTSQVNSQFSGGVDITVGKMFSGGNWGSSFTYWGIFPSLQQADIYSTEVTGNLGSYLNFAGLDYNSTPGTNYWNNVFHQRIHSTQTINSVEMNLLGNCGCGLWGRNSFACNGPCGRRFGTGWMMGVRYFHLNEEFCFHSDNADNVFDDSANEMQYAIRARNNLLGFQAGGGLNYRVWNCFSLYGTAKAGVYGNHAIVNQAIHGSAGDATVNIGPYAGNAYRFQSSQTSLAFLGQLDVGGRYQMNKCWSIEGGYRMVGVTGLALTDGQIPRNVAYLPDAQRVHAGDSLILHGGYIGASFYW